MGHNTIIHKSQEKRRRNTRGVTRQIIQENEKQYCCGWCVKSACYFDSAKSVCVNLIAAQLSGEHSPTNSPANGDCFSSRTLSSSTVINNTKSFLASPDNSPASLAFQVAASAQLAPSMSSTVTPLEDQYSLSELPTTTDSTSIEKLKKVGSTLET